MPGAVRPGSQEGRWLYLVPLWTEQDKKTYTQGGPGQSPPHLPHPSTPGHQGET